MLFTKSNLRSPALRLSIFIKEGCRFYWQTKHGLLQARFQVLALQFSIFIQVCSELDLLTFLVLLHLVPHNENVTIACLLYGVAINKAIFVSGLVDCSPM